MNGEWAWLPGAEQPTSANQWQQGQDLPYITQDSDGYGLSAPSFSSAFGPVGYVGPMYVPGNDTPISQYHGQVSTGIGPEQGLHSNASQYFGFAPYGHPGPPHIDNSFQVPLPAPLPAPCGRDHDEFVLDDFDRRLLATNELPAANLGSSRRLTLPVAQPGLNQKQTSKEKAFGPGGYTPYANHADASNDGSITWNQTQTPLSLKPDSFLPPEAGLLSPPSPAVATPMTRAPTRQHQSLQKPLQQETPPFEFASYTFDAADNGPRHTVAHSSPGSASSPAAIASSRRQSRARAPPEVMPQHRFLPTSRQPWPIQQQQHHDRQMLLSSTSNTPVAQGIPLVSPRQAFPNNHRFQTIFPFDWFNAIQSKCFQVAYGSTDNLVVSAPTGSGKTVIFELAICKMLMDRQSENFKVVYQAPTKALCSERARDWQRKFGPELSCAELTGDTSQAEARRVSQATIIVTTPEKWDSITRKWGDHRKLLELVKLLLIDEVHILRDARGATMEAVVSRMKSIGANVRFIALSATVPNSHDIASWLGLNQMNAHLQANLETFNEDFRPVKLARHIQGFNVKDNEFVFDKFLEAKVPPLLMEHAQGKPTLIFCFTKRSCESTAAHLAQWWTTLAPDKKPWSSPSRTVPVSAGHRELVKTGVAFHHAGLDARDRAIVEQAFIRGDLKVICCTSTLAVGVNLPCHTVVLKGTFGYQDGKLQELSDLDVLQMLGRAGRPQYDDTANAVILTYDRNVERYKKLVAGNEILESTLHLNLIEHLNSEIGLQTITDMDSAVQWLKSTYLSVRLQQNPDYYKLMGDSTSGQDIDSKLREICERDIRLLEQATIVSTNSGFKQTEYGKIMSRYMVGFSTMRLLLGIPRGTTMEHLLRTISQANEFKDQRFQPAERTFYRELNKSNHILYPTEEVVAQTWHKIFLLVQLYLSTGNSPDVPLTQSLSSQLQRDKKVVFERLQRLVRCVIDCKVHDRDSTTAKTALELSRSLAATAWEGRPSQLLQIVSVGQVRMRQLITAGVRTVKDLVAKDYGELERLWRRKPPTGKKVGDALAHFPLLSMDLSLVPPPKNTAGVRQRQVLVKATLRCLNQKAPLLWCGKDTVISVTFMAETTSGLLLHLWRGTLSPIQAVKLVELKFTAEVEAVEDQIECHFTCDEIVGTIVSKTLAHNIPASMFPAEEPTTKFTAVNTPQVNYALERNLGKEGRVETTAMADTIEVCPLPRNSTRKNAQAEARDESDYDSADFPAIEDIQDLIVVASPSRPRHAVPRPRPTPSMTAAGLASPALMRRSTSAKTTRASLPTERSEPMAVAMTACSNVEPILQAPNTKSSGISSAATLTSVTSHEDVDRGPVRLPSGKWQCNHACTGGRLTKGGKQCSHRCCLEGLDKARPRPKVKTSKMGEARATNQKRKADQDQGDANLDPLVVDGTIPSHGSHSSRKRQKSKPQAPASAVDSTDNTTDNRVAAVNPTNNTSWVYENNSNAFDLDEGPIDLVGDDIDDDDLPDIATLSARLKEERESKMEARKSIQKGKKPSNAQQAPANGQAMMGQSSETEGSLQRSFDSDFFEFDNYFNTSDVDSCLQGQKRTEESLSNQAFRPGVVKEAFFTGPDSSFPLGEGPALAQIPGQASSGSNIVPRAMVKMCDVASLLPSSYHLDSEDEWLRDVLDSQDGHGTEAHGDESGQGLSQDSQVAHHGHHQAPVQSSPSAAAAKTSVPSSNEEPQGAAAVGTSVDADWLGLFDQELVNSLRDYVDFV